MTNCPHCRKPLEDDSKFCGNCGLLVTAQEQIPPPPPPYTPPIPPPVSKERRFPLNYYVILAGFLVVAGLLASWHFWTAGRKMEPTHPSVGQSKSGDEFQVRLYNSNDGNCNTSGNPVDFYMDEKYLATVGPGKFISIKVPRGPHLFEAIDQPSKLWLTAKHITVNKHGHWLSAGCSDGSRPR
jgi:hypothetical protein